MKVTIAELAAAKHVDYVVASGLLRYLIAQGHAKKVDKRKSPNGKGKPTDIYEVPDEVNLKLAS